METDPLEVGRRLLRGAMEPHEPDVYLYVVKTMWDCLGNDFDLTMQDGMVVVTNDPKPLRPRIRIPGKLLGSVPHVYYEQLD
jgi:hypothetical protein